MKQLGVLFIALFLSACASMTPQEKNDHKYCEWSTGQHTSPSYAEGSAPVVGLLNLFSTIGESRRKSRAMDACLAERSHRPATIEELSKTCEEDCADMIKKGELRAGETKATCEQKLCNRSAAR